MDAKSVFSAHDHGPGVAQCEGDPDQEEKERGCEASQIEPESGGYIDLSDSKIIEVIDQMKENHQDDGNSSQEVHLPESDLPVFHEGLFVADVYRLVSP